jgi:hypothetical protein
METLFMMIVLAAGVIGGISVILCLSQILDPGQLRDMGRRGLNSQFTIWQIMAAVVVAALAFHAFTGPGRGGEFSFVLLALILLTWFVRSWHREFVLLMGLRDDEFPGRHDKLIWAVVLLAFAPIGIWFFRSYRLAHWPEPKTAIDPEQMAEDTGGTAAQTA